MTDVVKDGLKVISEVKTEIRDLISEFNDVSKLEAKFGSNKMEAALQFINTIDESFIRLNEEHIAGKQLISAWKGDFQEELNVKGADKAPLISELLTEMLNLELEIDNIVLELKKTFSDVLERMNSKKLSELKETQYSALVEDAKQLEKDLAKWIDAERKIKDHSVKCHNYIITYDAALQRKLANYKGLALGHFDDLLEGRGEYVSKSVDERRAILKRYWDMHAEKIKDMLDPVMLQRIVDFLSGNALIRDIGVKELKESMHFDESENRIRATGYKRHLRPNEFFSIVFDKTRNHDNFLRGYGEWLSAAFWKDESKLVVAIDPSIIWDKNNNKYRMNLYDSKGRDFKDDMMIVCANKYAFNIGDKYANTYYHFSDFPEELIYLLYGVSLKELENKMKELGRSSGIFLPIEEKCWAPLCLSIADDRIDIRSNFSSAASRGVR